MKFTSKILPPYLLETPYLDTIIPDLYLNGISGNAFISALRALLGDRADV